MLGSKEFRELLIADVALVRGVAEARDVAAALQRYWERRGEEPVSIREELCHIARLDPLALRPIEEEVDRLISEAGGDAQAALTRRGGIDRSIHLALSDGRAGLSQALTQIGAGVRAPLRTMANDRYLDFLPAGQGGMGLIYWALDSELGRQVAFKMIRTGERRAEPPETPLGIHRPKQDTPASKAFETLKARFLQEAVVTGGLEHPGIVPVYELGQTPGGIPYYTMRFVRGQRTLATAIAELKDAPVEDRLQLLEPFLKVCDTVSYAHSKGVIHRDLKPENVALGEFGEVVLLDWGLAKLEGQEDLAASRWQEQIREMREAADFRTVGMAGTPGYMSPEAALGKIDQVDQRSDVYSLGAVLFEILTGRVPFEFTTYAELLDALAASAPPSVRSIDRSVPGALSDLCSRCLAADRASRPARVEVLASSIRSWQAASTLEREASERLTAASAALDAADAAEGEAKLRHVERAAGALAEAEAKHASAQEVELLHGRADVLREAAVRERERESGRRLLRKVGLLALGAALIVAITVTAIVDKQRRRAESEQTAKANALREKEHALDLAKATLTDLRLERGRTELLAEKPTVAFPYLWQVLRERPNDACVRLLLGESLRPRDAHLHAREFRGSFAFVPRTSFLVSGVRGGELIEWNAATSEVRRRYKAPEPISSVAISPDGAVLLAGLRSGMIGVWDRSTGELERTLAIPNSDTQRSSKWVPRFSADGRTVIAWHMDCNRLHVWETASWERRAIAQGHEDSITSVSIGPRGEIVATASRDNSAKLWSAQTGTLLHTLRGHRDTLTAVAVDPSGKFVATASLDHTSRVWDVATGKTTQRLVGHTGSIYVLEFNHDGTQLLTGSHDSTLRVWSVESGLPISVIRDDASEGMFTPGGQEVATANPSGHARVWDVHTGALLFSTGRHMVRGSYDGHRSDLRTLRYSPEGGLLAASKGGTVQVWDARSRRRFVPLRGHTWYVTSVDASADGLRFLTTSYDRTAKVWNSEGDALCSYTGHSSKISSGVIHPGALYAVTVSEPGNAHVWSTKTGELKSVLADDLQGLRAMTFDPAGNVLASVDVSGRVRVWRMRDQRLLLAFSLSRIYRAVERPLVFSRDGRFLAAGHRYDDIQVWDVEASRRIARLRDESVGSGFVEHLTFSRSGLLRICAGGFRSAVVWDVHSGEILERLAIPMDEAAAYRCTSAVDADLTRLAIGDDLGGVAVWSLGAKSRMAALDAHADSVRSLCFSPDGRYLMTAGDDEVVRIWSADDLRLAGVLGGHRNHITSCRFSADGTKAITTDWGLRDPARVWSLRAEHRTVAELEARLEEWGVATD